MVNYKGNKHKPRALPVKFYKNNEFLLKSVSKQSVKEWKQVGQAA